MNSTNGSDDNSVKTIEVKAEDLDVDGGYRWIRGQADNLGGASTYGAIIYLCYGARYAKATMPDPT